MTKRYTLYLLWMFSASAALGLYAVALWFGALNQDEGWYLYAGRMVSEGMHPFVDYASTQGPVMAYVYALAQPLVELWGVAGGRLFTALMGFATLLCAALLAFRLSKDKQRGVAALLVFSLLGLNIYHLYFTSIVKTYSLAGLFVVLGFLALERSYVAGKSKTNDAMCGLTPCVSAGLFAFAAGVRLSAGILLPVVWLTMLWSWYRGGRKRTEVVGLVGFLVGGSIVLLSIFVPFFVLAPEAVKFGLLDYHSGRSVGSLSVLMAYKGGFVVRLIGSYFPLAVAAAVSIFGIAGMGKGTDENKNSSNNSRIIIFMLISVVFVTIVHLMTAFPYDDYQVFIMPVLAVVVSVVVAPLIWRVKYGMWVVVLLIIAHSVSSPMLHGWLLAERDRIWWPLRSKTQLQKLQRVADEVTDFVGFNESDDAILLTQDTYLAVELGMHVPRGMELGPFCYFPDMDREKAEACHVLNWEMLREVLVAGEAQVAAFSGYGLSISCPQISKLPVEEHDELWKLLEVNYNLVTTIDAFGQADTTLRILRCSEKK